MNQILNFEKGIISKPSNKGRLLNFLFNFPFSMTIRFSEPRGILSSFNVFKANLESL